MCNHPDCCDKWCEDCLDCQEEQGQETKTITVSVCDPLLDCRLAYDEKGNVIVKETGKIVQLRKPHLREEGGSYEN
jgi:hypothetical protein